MKNRSPIAVALLPLITFGIYMLYWEVKTKGEMNALGAEIPTAWLILIPLVNIWWFWKYCEGVEKVTNSKMNGALAFVLMWLLGSIGAAIVQASFNKDTSNPSTSPAISQAPVVDTTTTTEPTYSAPAPQATTEAPAPKITAPQDQPPTNHVQ